MGRQVRQGTHHISPSAYPCLPRHQGLTQWGVTRPSRSKDRKPVPAPGLLEPIVEAADTLLSAWKRFCKDKKNRAVKEKFFGTWCKLERLCNSRRLEPDDPNFFHSDSFDWPDEFPIRVVCCRFSNPSSRLVIRAIGRSDDGRRLRSCASSLMRLKFRANCSAEPCSRSRFHCALSIQQTWSDFELERKY